MIFYFAFGGSCTVIADVNRRNFGLKLYVADFNAEISFGFKIRF